ncbi:MAG: hypothetical protein JW751_30975 [Polyangiaceae bacterium]|nr:hypothetical protein [Polyangiaceae bacterium]
MVRAGGGGGGGGGGELVAQTGELGAESGGILGGVHHRGLLGIDSVAMHRDRVEAMDLSRAHSVGQSGASLSG